MISSSEAWQLILENIVLFSTSKVQFSKATGRTLQEKIYADRDFPPFNRVTMDGIAIAYQSYLEGERLFLIEGSQLAGMPQKTLQSTEHCLEVMTGTICPLHCDTVIRYEDIEIKEKEGQRIALIKNEQIQKGQNIHYQGQDSKANALLLQEGSVLNEIEMAILAGTGKSSVEVVSIPRIAIVSTGDELVDVGQIPQTHQVRRSNVYALEAALLQKGIPSKLYHLPDEKNTVLSEIKKLLEQYDLLLFSGGVSKGSADYIPWALKENGVVQIFHEVAQRPGKPLWFGRKGDSIVFALPGNPVSTLLCFHKYVLPFIALCQGRTENKRHFVRLKEDIQFKPNLTFFVPISIQQNEEAIWEAAVFKGNGSGDYVNLLSCNAFLELPPEKELFHKGEVYPCILFGNL